jgi:hypothetical protein
MSMKRRTAKNWLTKTSLTISSYLLRTLTSLKETHLHLRKRKLIYLKMNIVRIIVNQYLIITLSMMITSIQNFLRIIKTPKKSLRDSSKWSQDCPHLTTFFPAMMRWLKMILTTRQIQSISYLSRIIKMPLQRANLISMPWSSNQRQRWI